MSDSGVRGGSPEALARVLGFDRPELSCEECFAQLDRYVELSLTSDRADREVPGMRAHLDGCPACAEDFHSLRDLVATDQEGDLNEPALAAWKLPPIVAAITCSIVGGFYLGGPGLGMAVGALAAATILVMAIRKPPLHPIRPPAPQDRRRHILVALARPLEHGGEIEALHAAVSPTDGDRGEPEILLLAPCSHGFLARWTSDSAPGRERAQRGLVLSAASLAKAGIAARARVGDEDLRQGTEDELRSFPATEVIFVTGAEGEGAAQEAAIADLQSRLLVPSRRLCANDGEGEVRTRAAATPSSHDTRRAFAKQRFARQRNRQGLQHRSAGRPRRRAASRR